MPSGKKEEGVLLYYYIGDRPYEYIADWYFNGGKSITDKAGPVRRLHRCIPRTSPCRTCPIPIQHYIQARQHDGPSQGLAKSGKALVGPTSSMLFRAATHNRPPEMKAFTVAE